jgi:sugar lactone lactonase YvrE
MAVAPNGEVYVIDAVDPLLGSDFRVQVFSADGVFQRWWPVPIEEAYLGDITFGPDGVLRMVAATLEWSRVVRIGPTGEPLGDWLLEGHPGQLAVGPDGRHYIATGAPKNVQTSLGPQGAVMAYSADGRPLFTWDSLLVGPESVEAPAGIAVWPDPGGRETVYVSDSGNGRIQAYGGAGDHIGTIGRAGRLPGEFVQPGALAVDADGTIFVADSGNHRIQHVAPDGRVIAVWGSEGSGPGQFKTLRDLELTADGLLLVSDSGNRRIQVFSREGRLLGNWAGSDCGGSALRNPAGLTISADGNLWVTESNLGDSGSDQLCVYGHRWPGFWHVRTYRDAGMLEGPVHVSSSERVRFDWGLEPPAEGVPRDGFAARIERPAGSLVGQYDTELTVYGGVTVVAGGDGPPVVVAGDPGLSRFELRLELPSEPVRLDYADLGGRAAVNLELHRLPSTWLPIAIAP